MANSKDSILRCKIILDINDLSLQKDLLKVRNLSLQQCIDTCANENAVYQNKKLNSESVNKLKRRKTHSRVNQTTLNASFVENKRNRQEQNVPRLERTVLNARRRTILLLYVCKFATSSNKYVKPNKKIHQVEGHSTAEDEESDEVCINAVKGENNKYVKCIMHIDDTPAKFQLDTKSSVNILPEQYVDKYESANTVLKNLEE